MPCSSRQQIARTLQETAYNSSALHPIAGGEGAQDGEMSVQSHRWAMPKSPSPSIYPFNTYFLISVNHLTPLQADGLSGFRLEGHPILKINIKSLMSSLLPCDSKGYCLVSLCKWRSSRT